MTVVKLPLTARKSLRDDFESQLPELEKKLSTLLQVPWTISFDAALLYSYAEEGSWARNKPGDVCQAYAASAIYSLEHLFVRDFKTLGIEGLNNAAFKHVMTLGRDESGSVSYCGVKIVDGEMRLLYAPGKEGVNIGNVVHQLKEAVDVAEKEAGGDKLGFKARLSIEKDWTPKEAELTAAFETLIGKKVELVPSFEEVSKSMKAAGKKAERDDWENSMGEVVFDYFHFLKYNMKDFGGDDMMQEGFQEGVPEDKIGFRIVEKLEKNTYNECVIDDGILWIQTTADQWWVNVAQVGQGVIDLL
ncbi:MAG: hypothetical protein M1814_004009 [Vezdaea aestivalis]|nr:MAG: hypothetical protein M1814_004009 [Vezdaea aestivalis]